MNRDQVKGAIDEVVGSARRAAGELTGNTRLQVKGMAQQVKGKVEGPGVTQRMRSAMPLRTPKSTSILR